MRDEHYLKAPIPPLKSPNHLLPLQNPAHSFCRGCLPPRPSPPCSPCSRVAFRVPSLLASMPWCTRRWWKPHRATSRPQGGRALSLLSVPRGIGFEGRNLCFSGVFLTALVLCMRSPLRLPMRSCPCFCLPTRGLSPCTVRLQWKASGFGRRLPWKQKSRLSLENILSPSLNYLLTV